MSVLPEPYSWENTIFLYLLAIIKCYSRSLILNVTCVTRRELVFFARVFKRIWKDWFPRFIFFPFHYRTVLQYFVPLVI